MVFQNYALYPHMTVADNMGFALKISGMKKEEIAQAGGGGGEDPGPDRVSGPQAEGAVGWAAAAGGDGPGDRAQSAGVPDG